MYIGTVNLKQISTLSGFSVSTVSKALNNKKDISSETREVIQGIAKEYNYVPNFSALALRKQKSKTLAIIVPKIDENSSEFLAELQKQAFTHKYRLLIFQSYSSHQNELSCLNLVNDGSVDAVCLVSNPSNISLIERLNDSIATPLLLINLDTITVSNSPIGYLSQQYFNQILSKIK